jgi:hypothetical protein
VVIIILYKLCDAINVTILSILPDKEINVGSIFSEQQRKDLIALLTSVDGANEGLDLHSRKRNRDDLVNHDTAQNKKSKAAGQFTRHAKRRVITFLKY